MVGWSQGPLASFRGAPPQAFEEMFVANHECSTNRGVANSLIERIIARLVAQEFRGKKRRRRERHARSA